MLSEKARKQLRCRAMKPSGGQCRAYVVRGLNVCVAHSPLRSSGPGGKHPCAFPSRRPCTCPAYRWPHRKGSGPCRWPDPPVAICATPPRTRQSPEARAAQRAAFARARRLNTNQPAFPGYNAPIQPASSGAICIGMTAPGRRRVL